MTPLWLLALSALVGGVHASGSGSGSLHTTTVEVPSPSLSSVSDLQWTKCETTARSQLAADVECATLHVPVCHDGSCAQTHALKLMRRDVAENVPTVWTLFPSNDTDGLAAFTRFADIGTINVYGLQSRLANVPFPTTENATANSSPCTPLVDALDPPTHVDPAFVGGIKKCKRWIEAAYGPSGFAAFSLDSAATDLALAMAMTKDTSLTPEGPFYLYSSGSMTRTVQRFMVIAGETSLKSTYHISGYIFDQPTPMTLKSSRDSEVGVAPDQFVAACKYDETCRNKFSSRGKTMQEVLKQLYERLDSSRSSASRCLTALMQNVSDSTDPTPSFTLRRRLSQFYSTSKAGAQALAPLLFRVDRCWDDDLETILDLRKKYDQRPLGDARYKGMTLTAKFVDTLIEYSELWPSDIPSQNELINTYETTHISPGNMIYGLPSYCAYTASNSANCLPFYKGYSRQPNASLALVYPSNKSVDTTAATSGFVGSSTADVLVLTSRLSTLSTQDEALQLYEAFSPRSSGDRSTMLVVSDNLQGSEFTGEFAAVISNIVEMFVSKRTSRWNGKWYVTDLKPPVSAPVSTYETIPVSVSFTMTTDDRKVWFGGHDAYESGSSRYGYTTPTSDRGDCDDSDTNLYIWGGVIMGGLLIIAIWMGYVRMRQRRRHEELAREEAVRVQVQQDQFNRMYAVLQQSAALQASAPRSAPPEAPHNGIYGYSSYVHQPQSYSAPHSHAQGYDRQQYDYRRGY